jgi:hypothetical protein
MWRGSPATRPRLWLGMVLHEGYVFWAVCLILLLAGAALRCAARWRDAGRAPAGFGVARLAWIAVLTGAWLVGGLLAGAAFVGHPVIMGWEMEVGRLENSGRYSGAFLVCYGKQEARIRLHVRDAANGNWSLVEPGDYPSCAWPIEVRESGRGGRYLIVDSDAAAVALVDLEQGTILIGLIPGFPDLESLREDFGQDIRKVTDLPQNSHAYTRETLRRFRNLVESDAWRDAEWNAQGTLEAVHETTGLAFVLVPAGAYRMGAVTKQGRTPFETKQGRTPFEAEPPPSATSQTVDIVRRFIRPASSGQGRPVEAVDCVPHSAANHERSDFTRRRPRRIATRQPRPRDARSASTEAP